MLYRVISFFLCAAFPSVSISQELPRFDGVYIGLNDGTFEKLDPFVGQQIILKNFGNDGVGAVPQDFIPVVYSDVALQQEILSATFFDSDALDSIFIRSRTIRLLSVTTVMRIEDIRILGNLDKQDLARAAAAAVRLQSEFPALVPTACGVSANNMNLLNETDTTYQYFFEGSKPLMLNNGRGDLAAFEQKGESCSVTSRPSVGLLIVTNAGKFLLLETDAMREDYLPVASARWEASAGSTSQLTMKIDAADK